MGVLLYLEVRKLVCYYLMDAAQRHKILLRDKEPYCSGHSSSQSSLGWFVSIGSQSPASTIESHEGDKEAFLVGVHTSCGLHDRRQTFHSK